MSTHMKKRAEIDSKYKWNMTDIYSNESEWRKATDDSVTAAAEFAKKYSGRLKEGEKTVISALDDFFALSERFSKAATYASLCRSADGSDNHAREMSAVASSAGRDISQACSFLEPELLELPSDILCLAANTEAGKKYSFYIENLIRKKEHTLGKESERLLSGLSEVCGIPSDVYDAFCDVDMTFPEVEDSDGTKHELTSGNYYALRSSPDRTLRENAFNACFGEYGKYIHTFAETYSGAIKVSDYFTKARGYKSSLEKALFAGNIPVSVYDNLIESVHKALPAMKKYLNMRSRVMGSERLDMFDLYVPLISNRKSKMTYPEACDLVKKALFPLGDEYSKLLDRAFSENWIDVYENKGKTSGAFSCGLYGVHPFILMNYSDTLNDAFTLAHELGHAMHSYFSDNAQEYVNHGYKIFVAEVASTVNEVLMTLYLLDNTENENDRAFILNNFLEDYRTTVFRQTLFAEFEKRVFEMHENGVPVTSERLCELYSELLSHYYEGARINDVMKYEWAYIPHFYRHFYVYQYATGFCSAVAIARRIYDETKNAVPGAPAARAYLEFLKTGGSDYPINELRGAGVDLTLPDTVNDALALFGSNVDELFSLLLPEKSR